MIPNAWFYKLKDMNKSRNQQKIVYHNHVSKKKPHHTSSFSSSFSSSSSSSSLSSKEQQPQQLSHQRKSYYFSRDLSTTTAVSPAPAPPPGAERDNAETKTARNSDGKSSSSKKRRSGARRNRVSNRGVTTTSSSVDTAGGCSCRAAVESVWSKPDSTTPEEYPIATLDTTSSSSSSDENEAFTLPELGSNNKNIPCFATEKFDTMLSWSSSTYCRGSKLEKRDAENEPAIAKFQEPADDKGNGIGIEIGIDTVSQFNLRPIITNHHSSKTTSKKMESLTSLNATAEVEEPTKIRRDCGGPATTRKFSSGNYSSQGLKLRTNSPRIVSRRRIQPQGRKSVSKSRSRRSMSESFAVVKSSKDPQRDFRDSMVEMIIENNLCASKDLEDLLACYLSLNSDEYHDLIITVFKQIWFDIIDVLPN